MSEYDKTLQELWDEAGQKPFIAEEDDGTILDVIDIRGAVAVGYYDSGKGISRDSRMRYWKLHEPEPKLVKWYKPRVVWEAGISHPRESGGWSFYKTKDKHLWFSKPEVVKVLEWEEREFPETWEDCK